MMLASITLPTGPYDWHPEFISREEFESRLTRFRAAMADAGATHAVVHGNCFDHGALAWLSGFTPKLGPAYALVPIEGAPRLLFAGGPGMRPSAARLTWIEDVVALKGLEAGLREWLSDGAPRLALCEGSAMMLGDFSVAQRMAGGSAIALDRQVNALRRAKSSAELVLVERAALALHAATDKLAIASGSRCDAVLAAERAAYDAGAQDVRTRIGARPWGPPSIAGDRDEPLDKGFRVAMAARLGGYWAEAQFVVGDIDAAVRRQAGKRLSACLSAMKPDARLMDLEAASGAKVSGHGVGLSPEEAPFLADPGVSLADGDVCSITIDAAPDGQSALLSMLAHITDAGARLLWAPPGVRIDR